MNHDLRFGAEKEKVFLHVFAWLSGRTVGVALARPCICAGPRRA